MKAATYKKYGGPDVVRLCEISKPSPRENELIIKVLATTVNRTDTGFRSAEYVISRLFSGLIKPKIQVLGCEFAGEVVEIGSTVLEFKVGDRIFGYDDRFFGGHAEYKVIESSSTIAHVPDGMSFKEAAALTEGSHYALGNIRAAKLKPGDKVLVYGATGAIGSAAVQLLRHLHIFVVAVCNTKNRDLVKSLGADEVIDYQLEDFTQTPHRFDFVFDAVGKSSFGQCKPLMQPKGRYISTELGKRWENIWLSIITSFGSGKKVLFPIPTMTKEDILYLQDLALQGVFRPVLDKQYALDEIVEAHRYVESGQKTGNVIITLKH